MKIIAIETEIKHSSTGVFDPHLKAEVQKVWELHQSDVLREIYFRADQATAVLVLECVDVAEASNFLAQLPLVQAGLIAFEIIPLQPYPGFARLFNQQ